MKNDDINKLYIVAFVAIVAIMALAYMYSDVSWSSSDTNPDVAYDLQNDPFYSEQNIVGQGAALAYDCNYGDGHISIGGCGTFTRSREAVGCRRAGGVCRAPSR
jgi:hypothetical protein